MQDLKKVVPPDRVILSDITLAFLPGAKIGVLGANGAGKSSLLKIMALIDNDFLGDAKPAAGIRVGYLPQEPQLDESKDVLGNVEEGVAEIRALLERFEEIGAAFAEPLDGLASVEALFAALCLMGEWRPDLLVDYHWRDAFLRANPKLRRRDA